MKRVTSRQIKRKPFKNSEGVLAGKITFLGDLETLDTADLWDVVRCPEEVLNPPKTKRPPEFN